MSRSCLTPDSTRGDGPVSKSPSFEDHYPEVMSRKMHVDKLTRAGVGPVSFNIDSNAFTLDLAFRNSMARSLRSPC